MYLLQPRWAVGKAVRAGLAVEGSYPMDKLRYPPPGTAPATLIVPPEYQSAEAGDIAD